MKNKLSAMLILMLFASISFSQSIANKDLIGEWYGPNSTVMNLNSNGTGNMDLGSLKCKQKIISWSATTTTLNIHWDMTPIECLKLSSNEKFLYNPKIENDKPEYTITKTKSSLNGITTYKYTLTLNNKEYKSAGTYIRVEVEENED
jgi:hypothetical protein